MAENTEQSMVPLASDKLVVTNGLRSAIAIGKNRLMSHGLRSAIGKPRGDVATPALDPDQIVRSKGLASAIGGKPNGDVATPVLDAARIVRSKGLASAVGGKPRR